jgi:hypothetical protein
VVDFSSFAAGTKIVLENTLGNTDLNREALQFDVQSLLGRDIPDPDSSVVPAELGFLPALETATITRKFTLSLDMPNRTFLINGKSYDPHRGDFTVKRGSTEIWEVTNADNPIPHSMHIHAFSRPRTVFERSRTCLRRPDSLRCGRPPAPGIQPIVGMRQSLAKSTVPVDNHRPVDSSC